jgi:hypothetical protein
VSLWHPSQAPKIQTGSSQTDTSGNASITFTTPFPTTPKVFVQGKDANAEGIVIDIVSVSQTGFTVKARKVTGITTSSSGSHSHSFTPSGTISSTDLGSVTSGIPDVTRLVATDPSTWTTLYAASQSGGTPNTAFQAASTTTSIYVAGAGHTHSVTLGSHSHTFTGSSGTTSSTGAHTHTVDAPVLQIDFDWVAVAM